MKRSRFALTPLALVFLVAACTGDDVSSTGSISTVATSTTGTPTNTEAPNTTSGATVAPPSPDDTSPTTPSASTGETGLPTEACVARLEEAMGEGGPEDYVEAYYPALAECSGLQDWLAAVDQTGFDPGMDPTDWAADVCGLDGPLVAVTCQEAIATAQAG